MGFTLDFSGILALGMKSPLEIMWILFVNGGWIIVVIGVIRLWWVLRLYRKQEKFASQIEYTLLAIDIPKNSEQTPKAMEQVFATLSGAHANISRRDKYTKGEIQLSFSFEIVSIDGYIQFLIRTPIVFRDLVEGAVYAQYPDAEITEVEDYTKDVPTQYPNDTLNVWGSELQLVDNDALPIRTYQSFEDPLSQELKDPLASVLETMSRIQKGEQVWFQIIVVPTDTSWVKKSLAYAYKIAGKKTSASSSNKNWYDSILNFLYNLPDLIPFLRTGNEIKDQKQDNYSSILNLTPGERDTIEAIEKKAQKIGFVCKVRLVYLSPNEKYQSQRVVSSVFGAIKQFGDLTSNALKPNKRTRTSVIYFKNFRVPGRRRRIISNYKNRSWFLGSSRYFVLNTEELATLYHFPSITIKTPFVKRTEVKKSDSPVELPTFIDESVDEETKDLRTQLEGLELDNNYFEERYAKRHTVPSSKPHQNTGEQIEQKRELNDESGPDDLPSNLPIVE